MASMNKLEGQFDFPADRYDKPAAGWFRRCGRTGLHLPAISLGCWHNFGDAGTDAVRHYRRAVPCTRARKTCSSPRSTSGITHFDLANNYGPAPGAAEARVGQDTEARTSRPIATSW